ncbi:MAG TPA: tail fiber domain-containing protein, partial [Saprospiraceae bacterium]|nr:tail fiber domain-containing protein [Saprospiraceae bacterium]
FSSASGKGLIVESGRVGIGTDSPNADLEVLDGNFRVTGPEGSSLNIMTAYGHGSGICYYGLQYGTGSVGVFASNGGYALELDDLNNGGLGTGLKIESDLTHWNQYVDVAKDMNFANNGTLRAWIQDTDGSYHNSSDSRLKKDIKPFKNVLQGLTQLQAYTYHMKNAPDDSPLSVGFMAQEVEQQFPELVEEKDGYKSLCYDHFAVLSVQAIKEQQVEINQQQALITSQQSQLELQAIELKAMHEELAQLKLLVLQVAEKK